MILTSLVFLLLLAEILWCLDSILWLHIISFLVHILVTLTALVLHYLPTSLVKVLKVSSVHLVRMQLNIKLTEFSGI